MFENVSTQELQAELKRRQAELEQEEKEQAIAEKPKQLEIANLDSLRKICQEYIDELDSKEFVDEDYDNYIYEVALECIFGKDVWKWINKKLD